MEELSHVLAHGIEKISGQIAALGPDAQRVYLSMLKKMTIEGVGQTLISLVFIVIACLLFIKCLAAFKRNVGKHFIDQEDWPIFVAPVSVAIFLIAFICLLHGVIKMKEPEAVLIERLILPK